MREHYANERSLVKAAVMSAEPQCKVFRREKVEMGEASANEKSEDG